MELKLTRVFRKRENLDAACVFATRFTDKNMILHHMIGSFQKKISKSKHVNLIFVVYLSIIMVWN